MLERSPLHSNEDEILAAGFVINVAYEKISESQLGFGNNELCRHHLLCFQNTIKHTYTAVL